MDGAISWMRQQRKNEVLSGVLFELVSIKAAGTCAPPATRCRITTAIKKIGQFLSYAFCMTPASCVHEKVIPFLLEFMNFTGSRLGTTVIR